MNVGLAFDRSVLSQPRFAASVRSLDVLLFPELMDGGYAALKLGEGRHTTRDAFFDDFRNLTRNLSLYCVAGSACLEDTASSCTNTSLVFAHGRVVHRYDKMHLFAPTGDTDYFTPGKTIRTFTIVGGRHKLRAGIIICYDLRFPELVRRLAIQGMQLLLVPARWPRARDDAWFTLLKSRAIENQIFVVGCNALGEEGGYSYVFDPRGKLLYSNRRAYNKVLQRCTIDLRQLEVARVLHNNLRDAVLLRSSYRR